MKCHTDKPLIGTPYTPRQNYFYVYLLIDPRDELPFYVGKGSGDRARRHLTGRDGRNKGKVERIREIRLAGYEPTVKIWSDELLEADAYDLEEQLIELYGRRSRGGILTNIGSRRRPPSRKGEKLSALQKKNIRDNYSDERRRKISIALTGKSSITEAGRKKLSDTKKGNTIRLGQKHTEEAKAKMKGKVGGGNCLKNMTESEIAVFKKNRAVGRALVYLFVSPTGETYISDCIKKFCDQHPELVYSSFQSAIYAQKCYKGWTASVLGKANAIDWSIFTQYQTMRFYK